MPTALPSSNTATGLLMLSSVKRSSLNLAGCGSGSARLALSAHSRRSIAIGSLASGGAQKLPNLAMPPAQGARQAAGSMCACMRMYVHSKASVPVSECTSERAVCVVCLCACMCVFVCVHDAGVCVCVCLYIFVSMCDA